MSWFAGEIALPARNNYNNGMTMVTALTLQSNPMGAYDGHFVLFRDTALQAKVMRFLGSAALGMAEVQ